MTDKTEEKVQIRTYLINVRRSPQSGRIDSYLSDRFPDYSRTFIKKLIKNGRIKVGGSPVKPSYSPSGGDRIVAEVPTITEDPIKEEDIDLDIIYEDEWILVINKPYDMVVHPSRGHGSGTLVNAAVFHCQNLSSIGGALRPGIVHRLDKDTTGAIIMVKDGSVHQQIAGQFEERTVEKRYLAVCEGRFELDSDVIDAPIGKHGRAKEKMAVRHDSGKSASTIYEVVERLGDFTVVRCFPRSGRTHQIRVHLRHIGHPIVCDRLYGQGRAVFLSDMTGGEHCPAEQPLIERQALHAESIRIYHPGRREEMTFEAPVPSDMAALIEVLRSKQQAGNAE